MVKPANLVGCIFGELRVVERYYKNSKSGAARWLCDCSCGKTSIVISHYLLSGKIKSCGHLKSQRAIDKNTTHGMTGTRFYNIWSDMKNRCDSKGNSSYKHYGGRGIRYSEDWSCFENFYKDMYDTYEDKLTLERVDVNGDYCKSNCVWATYEEQSKNRRKQSNNTSGHTGIKIRYCKNGSISYTVVWVEFGKNCSKVFSSLKYEDPLAEAIKFRAGKLLSLGYAENHGL